MFHKSHSFRNGLSSRKSHGLFLIALILALFLAAAMPAFAAYPEEADPDPERTSSSAVTQELVLTDLAELDTDRLAPGCYVVRIVDAEGAKEVFEIVVPSRWRSEERRSALER